MAMEGVQKDTTAADQGTKLRSYQTEMLEASLKKNIIVAMDTGSGKTHIAVARIRLELERTNGKLIWFLTPSKTLAEQQYQVLSTDLLGYGIRLLTGADGCDKWSDQRLWDAYLKNIRVVVATPAILLDALSHGFMHMSRLALCVFDEAHHSTKKHPMNNIMKLFYHPARERGECVPHILGLTASPVVNSKEGMLNVIESNLNALAVTPKEHRHELEKFVNPPKLKTILYEATREHKHGNLGAALGHMVQTYNVSADPYVLDLVKQDHEKSRNKLTKVMMKRRTYCLDQLRALDIRAAYLLEQLGPQMADWYVAACIDRFEVGLASQSAIMPDLSEKERQHLHRIFKAMRSGDQNLSNSVDVAVTPKAAELVKILEDCAAPSLRAIIFVEQRVMVTALKELLSRSPRLGRNYGIAAFVGTSTSDRRKISVADLVALQEQGQDLEDFRNGKKNLMIATNVLEEGIDISACNLVICFDEPQNLVSFVQRRGRARQHDSKYFVFVSRDKLGQSKRPWAELEAEMKKLYSDDTRQLEELKDEDDSEAERKHYRVDATEALLTLDIAKSHLYHFCVVCISQTAGYLDLRPEYETSRDEELRLWTAIVRLPSFVHPELRTAKSARAWPREELAIKDASFEAYVALHNAGLVNDNLLPPIERHSPEEGQQHVDQPPIIRVSDRLSTWSQLSADQAADVSWSQWIVKLKLGDEVVVELGMRLPDPHAINNETFELHWNEHTKYVVTMERADEQSFIMQAEELASWRQSTYLILQSVHANRMAADLDDFPILFAPTGILDIRLWNADCYGQESVTSISYSAETTGLVHVRNKPGRMYFLQNGSTGDDEDRIWITSFPKRRDFLHPVAESNNTNAAYTSKEQVPISDCTIDRLPAKFALFAVFVPSILHRVDVSTMSATLRSTCLKDVDIRDSSLVLQALCSPSAREETDYNRLEYLGDTILKHCTELQVMAQYPKKPEGLLTVERDKIIRNSNLAQAALAAGLDRYIVTQSFTGAKWRPPLLSQLSIAGLGSREMSTKTLADVVESLIGAAYVDGNLAKAFTCVKTLLPTETWDLPAHCFDTLLSNLGPSSGHGLALLEKLIGYTFTHKQLLVEAITHVSVPYNETGLSYERLEFIGDSVLDMIITPKLFAHSRNLRHWELHRLHEALVNKYFLGYCCMAYMMQEDQNDVFMTSDGQHGIVAGKRNIYLHDFLRADPQVAQIKRKAVAQLQQELAKYIRDGLEQGTSYPWVELLTLVPPKFFSDMIESVLGAIYLDSRGDLDACEVFIERLGVMKYMHRILDHEVDCLHPKERVGILADQESVQYAIVRVENENGGKSWVCTIRVGDEDLLSVQDCMSQDEAEVKAAHQACAVLKERSALSSRSRKRKLDVASVEGARDKLAFH